MSDEFENGTSKIWGWVGDTIVVCEKFEDGSLREKVYKSDKNHDEAIDVLKQLVSWWHDTSSIDHIREAKSLGYPFVIARAISVLEDAEVKFT